MNLGREVLDLLRRADKGEALSLTEARPLVKRGLVVPSSLVRRNVYTVTAKGRRLLPTSGSER